MHDWKDLVKELSCDNCNYKDECEIYKVIKTDYCVFEYIKKEDVNNG